MNLLWLSSRQRRGVLHEAVEVAGEVALEEAGGFAGRLAFGYTACDVAAGRGVVLSAMKDDRVQGAIELAIAAAAEAVPDRLPARGW